VGAHPSRHGEHPEGADGKARVPGQETGPLGRDSPRRDCDLGPPARTAHRPGRSDRGRAHLRRALRRRPRVPRGRSRAPAPPPGLLHPEVRVRRGGTVVARPVRGRWRARGLRGLDQVHGAGESHPLAYQIEELPTPARALPGLDLGRWDYMASCPLHVRRREVVLPDRSRISTTSRSSSACASGWWSAATGTACWPSAG
jgi:hypothetical protein